MAGRRDGVRQFGRPRAWAGGWQEVTLHPLLAFASAANPCPPGPYYVLLLFSLFAPFLLPTTTSPPPRAAHALSLHPPTQAFSLFAITHAAVRSVGLFDENFFPAYLEDCDYE